ncbi:GBP6 [Symbiodinium sp. CCMP2592]|nr:GBP6 [Symbiodinium sp. CCMP2592]
MLIDGQSGEILATNVMFSTRPQKIFVLEGHGTRQHSALHVASATNCVVITRSQDGYVSIFSSEHLLCSPEEARCFRLREGHGQGQFTVVMEQDPLQHFGVTGRMDFAKQASDALQSIGFAGRSTFAGNVIGKSFLRPAAKALDAHFDVVYQQIRKTHERRIMTPAHMQWPYSRFSKNQSEAAMQQVDARRRIAEACERPLNYEKKCQAAGRCSENVKECPPGLPSHEPVSQTDRL